MKNVYLFIIFGVLFFPFFGVQAQVDQRCFTEKKCLAERNGEAAAFHQSIETRGACGGITNDKGEKLGFCLPAGVANTAIKIGGQSSFSNIGDYIQNLYRYGVSIAGLLAVIMIITSGLQWAMSGGNTSIIQSAKKRLGGAILGLILVTFSYAILNNINPYLVNFRLPQIWLINSQAAAPALCKDSKEAISISLDGPYDKKGADAICGTSYYVSESGGAQCKGTKCASGKVCAPEGAEGANICIRGDFAGYIYNAPSLELALSDYSYGLLAEQWAYPWVERDGITVEGVCNDGKTFNVGSTNRILNDTENETQKYSVEVNHSNANSKIVSECGGKEKFKGYVMVLDMNENNDITEEDHYIGFFGGAAIDLGDDGAFDVLKYNLSSEYFIQTFGQVININAGEIFDIDIGLNPFSNENAKERRKKAYGGLGYK